MLTAEKTASAWQGRLSHISDCGRIAIRGYKDVHNPAIEKSRKESIIKTQMRRVIFLKRIRSFRYL